MDDTTAKEMEQELETGLASDELSDALIEWLNAFGFPEEELSSTLEEIRSLKVSSTLAAILQVVDSSICSILA